MSTEQGMQARTVVAVSQHDVEQAARDGVISPQQAHALWLRWSAGAPVPAAGAQPWASPVAAGPQFGFVNVLYYFGALLAIGAMSLFMTVGFTQVGPVAVLVLGLLYGWGALTVAAYFKARGLLLPAGLLATLAVFLVPLVVWSVQDLMGWWSPATGDALAHYHRRIDWRWLSLEWATLLAGVVMLWFYRLPFMVMPLAWTLWYMSMDVTSMLRMDQAWDWALMRTVSLLFGIATVAVAMWVDVRTRLSQTPAWRQDFAYWLYLFGVTMVWCGLSFQHSDSEWAKLAYCGLNVLMVFLGAAIGRRVFTVYGALGVVLYLGYLSYSVFQDSFGFPLVLTLLGLGMVAAGVWWQRHEQAIAARLLRYVPAGLQPRV